MSYQLIPLKTRKTIANLPALAIPFSKTGKITRYLKICNEQADITTLQNLEAQKAATGKVIDIH